MIGTTHTILGIPPTTMKPGADDPGQSIGSYIGVIVGGAVAFIIALGLVTVTLAFFSYCFM